MAGPNGFTGKILLNLQELKFPLLIKLFQRKEKEISFFLKQVQPQGKKQKNTVQQKDTFKEGEYVDVLFT
jgi:hypothetical protein